MMKFTEFKKQYQEILLVSTMDNPNVEFTKSVDSSIVININKELSASVIYAIWFFNEHVFSGEITVNNSRKTEFSVNRDGVTDTFRLTSAQQNPQKCDIKSYMNQFEKSFNMKCEIERLKALRDSR